MKNLILALSFTVACSSIALAQATPAASRLGDLQVGATYTNADSDYVPNRINGYGFYGDFDFLRHIGAEVDFHQLSDGNSPLYERSYEFGGRYFWRYGRFKPYGKALYGRGVLNFPVGSANLAYNMLDFGAGVDIAVQRHINVRAEYEYQKWFSGLGLPQGLSPTMFTVGAAYHFPPGKARRR
ncbi:MAG TPA: outer membrane beta-barrel protein [Granulicella sp.]